MRPFSAGKHLEIGLKVLPFPVARLCLRSPPNNPAMWNTPRSQIKSDDAYDADDMMLMMIIGLPTMIGALADFSGRFSVTKCTKSAI